METIHVTTGLDIVDSRDNRTSLREAIALASKNASPTVITFSHALSRSPILLSQNGPDATAGDLDVTQGNITIEGNGRKNTIISSGGSDTGFSDRIFHIQGTANVVFVDLTIRGGTAEHGAGILHTGTGEVIVEDVLMTENVATNTGGAIAAFRGPVQIVDSTIEANSAAFGGGIGSLAPLSVKDSTIAGNVASGWGGGVYAQGSNATTTIESSTVSDNRGRGGGLANRNSTSEIDRSTFSGNRSTSAGAILNIADSAGTSSVSIRRSTITNNHSSDVGSVHTMASIDAADAPLTFGTSLFVGNLSTSGAPFNLSSDSTDGQNAALISTGRNLLDDDGAGSLTAADIGDVDTVQTPVVNPTLTDNGGATMTHALLTGSPALGAGGSEIGFAGQRGPVLSENLTALLPTDIGAYQVRAPNILLSVNKRRVLESGSTTLDVVAKARGLPSDLEAAGLITVRLSASGTAVANDDYTLSANTITIPQGATTGAVTLTAIDDPVVESPFETIALRIDGVSENARLGQAITQTVQIQDNDEAEISLAGTDVDPREPAAQFEIRLSHPVDIPVRLGFRTNDGEAVAGVHFEGVSDQTVQFAAGQTVATVEVPLIDRHTGTRAFTGEVTWVEAEERIVKHATFTKTRVSRPVVIGDVHHHVLSDDGSTLLYVADQDTFTVNELYSVPADGSAAPVKLNAPLEPQQDIAESVKVTRDGQWAVYEIAEMLKPGVLFSVRSDGSNSPVQLPLPDHKRGAKIHQFVISPDGSRVVYKVRQWDDSFDLYSVPIDGSSAAIKLNESTLDDAGSSATREFQFSADGTRVLCIARYRSLPPQRSFNLLSFPVDGSGEPGQINASLELNEDVSGMSVNSVDNTVVYATSVDYQKAAKIYRGVVDGSAEPIQLATPPRVKTHFQGYSPFTTSADGRTVVYIAYDGISDRASLHRVSSDGQSGPVKLEGTSDIDHNFRVPLLVSSDGSRLVYAVSDYRYKSYENVILSVATDGTEAPIPLFREAGLRPKLHALSADSQRVFFSVVRRTDSDSTAEFYSLAIDGSTAATMIVGGLPAGTQFTVSGDGSFLVYQTEWHTGAANQLYRVALQEPSHPTRLSGDLIKEDRVSHIQYSENSLSQDGSRILYRTPAGFYAAPTDGSTTPVQLDIPQYTLHLRLSPDGRWVVFQSDRFATNHTQLYVVPTGHRAKPIMLSMEESPSRSINRSWFITPDSRSVIFVAIHSGLYIVPIDGDSAPERLQVDAGPNGIVVDARGRQVAYVRHASGDENDELFVGSLDGTSPIRNLISPDTSWSGFEIKPEFRFTPDSKRIVFRAAKATTGLVGLYSVLVDGSAPPIKLNPTNLLTAHQQEVLDFVVSADSQSVLYRGRNRVSGMISLRNVRIDGTTPPFTVFESPLDNSAEEFYGASWGKPVAFDRRYLVVGDRRSCQSIVRIDQPSPVAKCLPEAILIDRDDRFSSENGRFFVRIFDEASQGYGLYSYSATGTSLLDAALVSILAREEGGTRVFYTAGASDSDETPLYAIDARTIATIYIDDQSSESAEKVDAVFHAAASDVLELVFEDGDAVIRSTVEEHYRFPADRMNTLTIDVSDGGTFSSTHEAVAAVGQHGAPLTVITGAKGKLEMPERWRAMGPLFIDAVLTHRGRDDLQDPAGELLVVADNAWQNPFDHHDVDGNGRVEPLDALLIINALQRARQASIALDQPTGEADSNMPKPYWDVSGNGFVEPVDALLVLNRLNAQSRQN